MIDWLLGKYIVFEINSGVNLRRFWLLERAIDLCAKLNTEAYLGETGRRYDVAGDGQ